ncbi:phosphatase PAP2 family protein [Francisellaceae bacterium]|nr:phosphatase PAP2 family protein [Francisellaceae bacterium]
MFKNINMVNAVNNYLFITIPVVSIFAIISILYFDRPLAEFFYDLNTTQHLGSTEELPKHIVKFNNSTPEGFVAFWGSHATNICYMLILPFFIFYFYRKLITTKKNLIRKSTQYFNPFLGQFIKALVFAFYIKSALKYVFGRTSPLLEHERYLSFIADPNSYYFHFFDITGEGASFPSGHMCIFSALMLTISIYYKKLSPICLILAIGLFTGLLYFDLHYLSDLVVGTYIGITTALGLYLLDKTK